MFATLPRVAGSDQPRRRRGGGARRRRRSAPSGWRSSARRWRPAPRSRSAGRSAFVGIVVPHLVRLIVGADHRLVLPASALFGAAFLIGCDFVARTICRAARAAGRHRHRADRRTVLSVAAGEESMTARRDCVAAASRRLSSSAPTAASCDASSASRAVSGASCRTAHRLARPGGDRDAVRDGRRRAASPASATTTTFRPRSRGCRRSAGCSIRRRADPRAEARPGHRLRHADGSDASSSIAPASRTSPTSTAALPDITDDDPGARRADRIDGARPTRSRRRMERSLADDPRADRRAAAAATLLVFGREPGVAAQRLRQRRLRLPARHARDRRRRATCSPTSSSRRCRRAPR